MTNKAKSDVKDEVRSTPVPKRYKFTSKIMKQHLDSKDTLKSLLATFKKNIMKRDIKGACQLLYTTQDYLPVFQKVLEDTELLTKEPKFRPSLAYILCTELLVHKKSLDGDCKPFQLMREYKDELVKSFEKHSEGHSPKSNVLYRYVRVNKLRSSVADVNKQLKLDGWKLVQYKKANITYSQFLDLVKNLGKKSYTVDYHIEDLLVFPCKTSFQDSKLYKDKLIILQDKASCIPVHISGVEPGSSVLDVFPTRGNKTLQLANIVGSEGNITAVAKNKDRYDHLKESLTKHGASSVKHHNVSPFQLPDDVTDGVEYIFVDPPCSSSGFNVLEEDVFEKNVKRLSDFQFSILEKALLIPSVKSVIYSTFSINKQENEEVVQKILEKYGDKFGLENIRQKISGLNGGAEEYAFKDYCIRTISETDLCCDAFVVKFVKKDSVTTEDIFSLESDTTKKISKKRKHIGEDELNTSTNKTKKAKSPSVKKAKSPSVKNNRK